MRSVRTIQGLMALAMPLFGAFVLLAQASCSNDDENTSRFFTFCDNTGCYQCGEAGCTPQDGLLPGMACGSSKDCAAGCYCATDSKCAEAGFCDRPSDCSTGFVCNVARHSCEPGSQIPPQPKSCKLASDCAVGSECINASCRPVPLPPNPCVFSRECGAGGACVDGLCQKGCTDDSTCGTGRSCLNQRCVPKPADATSCINNAACGASQTCIDSFCHVGCAKDAECQAVNPNDICVASVCRPDERRVPECKFSSDCATGTECVNAQCRTFCYADSDCTLCTDTTLCSSGYCMTPSESNPQCRLPADCKDAALHCVNALCGGL